MKGVCVCFFFFVTRRIQATHNNSKQVNNNSKTRIVHSEVKHAGLEP